MGGRLKEAGMLTKMTDADWITVLKVFEASRSRRSDKGRDDKKFLSALHYFAVHNITWRALPAEFGNWNSVWKRFWRLSQAGVFEAFFEALAAMSDTAHLIQIKPIAILSKTRSSNLPDLPSAHEQGLTNFDLPSWYALFLPAKTPQPIIQRLNRAAVAALEMPSLQQHLKQVGGDVIAPERRSPEYLAQFLAAEIKKWEGPIKASGVSF
jgi:transposase